MKGVVSWAETDASGLYHFASVFRWVEDAEHAMYRSAVDGADVGRFPRRTVEVSYERPLRAGDEYLVDLRVVRLGRSSIGFEWTISSAGDACVTGSHTVVHVDDEGSAVAVPSALRAALSG